MSAFYRFDGEFYHPLQPAIAPWTRRHQNGTSVGGLLAREVERTPAPRSLRTARLTIEIQRAAPLAPTVARAQVLRQGEREQLVEAELVVDGEQIATALGLRVCEGEGPRLPQPGHGLPAPEAAPRQPLTSVLGEGHPMQTRVVKGVRAGSGPGAYWSYFNADLVAGEAASATVRAVMACDIAAAVSNGASTDWAFPNIDLSLYLARAPQGGWTLTDAVAEQYGEGYGLISSVLSDAEGPFGYAHQTLLYAAREPSPTGLGRQGRSS